MSYNLTVDKEVLVSRNPVKVVQLVYSFGKWAAYPTGLVNIRLHFHHINKGGMYRRDE